jgi:four helix bundle protein
MKLRTKKMALRVIEMVRHLPVSRISEVITKQILRSATSVGANYRAACRARSRAEYLAKLGIVEEEVDETGYWLELIVEANLFPLARLEPLMKEVDEITAMIVSTIKSTKSSGN